MNSEMIARISSGALRCIAEPALRAIFLAAAAALALSVFRVRSASAKHAVWTAVLAVCLALPFLSWILPAMSVPLPMRHSLPQAQGLPLQARDSADRIRETTQPTRIVRSSKTAYAAQPAKVEALPVAKREPITWSVIAFAAYLLVLTVLAGRIGIGWSLTQRMRRGATPIDDLKTLRLIESCLSAAQAGKAPRLLESHAVTVPLTLGVLQLAIVIPPDWRDWEDGKLAAVIMHELSHVQRRDPLVRLLAAAYRSIFWFSPLGWWLEYHLADLGEQASDQAAISAGTEPTYYAEVLMSFFRTIQNGQGRIHWQGARMAGGGRTASRIERVLSLKMLRPAGWSKSLITAAIAGALPLVLLIAAARPKFVLAAAAMPQPALAQSAPAPIPAPAPPVAPLTAPSIAAPAIAPGAPPVAPAPPSIRFAVSPVPPLPSIAPRALPMMAANDDKVLPLARISRDDLDFAIVSGESMTINGSGDDHEAVEALRKKISGDFIWFIHAGNAYVITDAATVKAAQQLYAPMDDLGKRQEELGKQQEELGKQQEELGKQMEAIQVSVPADLIQRLQAVEAKIKALGGSADMDQLGNLQGELGDLQGQLGDLQGKAGDSQGKLGEQQGALGEKQGELGRRQGELGKEQARIGREAARQMLGIIVQALASGTAKPAE